MTPIPWADLTRALVDVSKHVRRVRATPGTHPGAVDALRDGVDALGMVLAHVARTDPRDAAEAQYVAQMAVLVLGDVRAAIEAQTNSPRTKETQHHE